MANHRVTKPSKKQAATAAGLITAVAGTILGTAGAASAASITSSYIISQPHAVQRACAVRILAAQGPGAWTAWSGSLDNMMRESGNNDKAVNASSGAAGYYQIMPSTWADLCSDLGSSGAAASTVSTTPTVAKASTAPAPAAPARSATTQPSAAPHTWQRSTSSYHAAATPSFGHYVYSSYVQSIQRHLLAKGYSVGPEGADGLLGPHTWAGVVKFQRDHGLQVDGIPGVHTWAALNS